jgi:hypothetical protein
MPTEVSKEIELEIAHVLFLDIVGYSKLSVNEQHGRVDELNGIVRLSEQFQKAEAANRILKIPTGDGMALVFYKSPEEPAQCAFEISRTENKMSSRRLSSNKRRPGTTWAVAPLADSRAQLFGVSSRASWCRQPQTIAETRVPTVRRPSPRRRVAQPGLSRRIGAGQTMGDAILSRDR